MKEYLVFRLYGPMASWGLPAVGGDRPSAMQPTRSAILGLLGAALGIKRDNASALSDLQQSVQIAVKQSVPGSIMRDYHTTQVPSHNNKIVHRSRKSELAENKLNTILSSRDYRCDGLWVIAISLTNMASFTLESLQNALKSPVYSLSLGRKSCPLAAPLMPLLVQVETLKSALDTEFPPLTRSHQEDALWLGFNSRVTYFWEGEKSELDDPRILTTHPWDEPVHRERWQFEQRAMHQLSVQEDSYVSF
jgi:CRISPR system Cascade subunit CasD